MSHGSLSPEFPSILDYSSRLFIILLDVQLANQCSRRNNRRGIIRDNVTGAKVIGKIFFYKRTLLAIAMKVAVKITRTRVRRIFLARVRRRGVLSPRSVDRQVVSERAIKKPSPRGLSGLGGGKCVIDNQGRSLSARTFPRRLNGFPRASIALLT